MFRRINLLKQDILAERSLRKRIGKYELIGDLLQTEHNKLLIGVDSITGQSVSIKEIPLNSIILQQFAKNQISIIKSLNHHPNILTYLHHYHINNCAYLITQLCQSNLHHQIRTIKTFSVEQALIIFKQILDGYGQMRQKGFIHRDLKPQNIFIKDRQYKIGDFGFAVQLKQLCLKEKFNVGTPFYMAPQVLLGNKYSQKSDIWSLGLILYELLYGKLPFKSKTELQLKRQIFVPFRNSLPSKSKQVDKIITKCLQIFVQKRINLKQLKTELNNFFIRDHIDLNQKPSYLMTQKIVQYEIISIKLLQYIIRLTKKCRNDFKPERIAFISEYLIKIKIKILKNTIEKIQQSSFGHFLQLKKEFQALQDQHKDNPAQPISQNQKSRFHFFNYSASQNVEEIIWQIQAILKQEITKVFKQLKSLQPAQLLIYDHEIKLLDFAITFFALNKLQILDKVSHLQQSKLIQTILNSPTRMTADTFVNMENKLFEMKIL